MPVFLTRCVSHLVDNVTDNAAIVTAADVHAADLQIALAGVHLGLTASDFLLG